MRKIATESIKRPYWIFIGVVLGCVYMWMSTHSTYGDFGAALFNFPSSFIWLMLNALVFNSRPYEGFIAFYIGNSILWGVANYFFSRITTLFGMVIVNGCIAIISMLPLYFIVFFIFH